MYFPNRRKGFTLVELLVVIGIIAILVAILLPVLFRAKWNAKLVACASTQRQFVQAMQAYANLQDGYLPRFDGSAGAGNLHDLTLGWYNYLHIKLELPDSVFFCPLYDETWIDGFASGGFTVSGYEFWVPRTIDDTPNGIIPPDPSSARFTVVGTDLIRGPKKLSDPLATVNPVISDDVLLFPDVVSNPNAFDVANAPANLFYQDRSGHMRDGKLSQTNIGFIDGHVERVDPSAVRLRYRSDNAWNCR